MNTDKTLIFFICVYLCLSVVNCLSATPEGKCVVRDVKVDGDWGKAEGLRVSADGGRADIVDATGQDRAITLAYVVPLDATAWRWWDGPEKSREIGQDGDVFL